MDSFPGRTGFDRLIGPVERAVFLEQYYQTKPLVIERGDAGYYDDVLTLDAVWDYIEAHCPAPRDINLIKFDAALPDSDWAGANRRADPARIHQLYADGWTIGLNKMHERLPALAGLCAAAEAVFSCPFQTNLYLTPPGAQGFRPHWDTHDVFVLQVHGSKRWTLYDTQVELPLRGQSFDIDKPEPGPASDSFTLHAGDLHYCPRGLMHSAESTTEPSLHITLGLMGQTWTDLLVEAVAELALRDVTLRRNLPTGYARPDSDPAVAAAEFRRVLDAVTTGLDLEPVLNRFREQFIAGRPRRLPGHGRQLARLGSLHAQSRVRPRPDLVVSVSRTDETVTVGVGGSDLTLPSYAEPALLAALEAECTVAGLPGPLDSDGKLALVRRLVREGLVLIA